MPATAALTVADDILTDGYLWKALLTASSIVNARPVLCCASKVGDITARESTRGATEAEMDVRLSVLIFRTGNVRPTEACAEACATTALPNNGELSAPT